MTIEAYGREARAVLSCAGWPVPEASVHVRPVPGLYSIQADVEAWGVLGLEHRAGIPLYVGKSETSLADRELGQHFAINPAIRPRTGSSTLRRSFAGLLHEQLRLRGVPRNKVKPGHFANFGLEPEGDRLLTRWMQQHLTLSAWPMPDALTVSSLGAIELDVIRAWTPPLNIAGNPDRLGYLRVARARLAAEAKAWSS